MKRLTLSFFLLSLTSFAGFRTNPVVLVHGYGPRPLVNMLQYKNFLLQDGYKSGDVLLLDYPQLSTPEEITKEVKVRLEKFLKAYPKETKIDLITHSYGNFVGLYAPLEAGLGERVEYFIGLAGIARGMNHTTVCRLFGCGKTIPLLNPFMSPFVSDFLTKHEEQISNYKKCALFSKEDAIVNDPPDSGALPGGINVEVTQSTHMDFIRSADLYAIMKTACYGVDAPAAGFRHKWQVR